MYTPKLAQDIRLKAKLVSALEKHVSIVDSIEKWIEEVQTSIDLEFDTCRRAIDKAFEKIGEKK